MKKLGVALWLVMSVFGAWLSVDAGQVADPEEIPGPQLAKKDGGSGEEDEEDARAEELEALARVEVRGLARRAVR